MLSNLHVIYARFVTQKNEKKIKYFLYIRKSGKLKYKIPESVIRLFAIFLRILAGKSRQSIKWIEGLVVPDIL